MTISPSSSRLWRPKQERVESARVRERVSVLPKTRMFFLLFECSAVGQRFLAKSPRRQTFRWAKSCFCTFFLYSQDLEAGNTSGDSCVASNASFMLPLCRTSWWVMYVYKWNQFCVFRLLLRVHVCVCVYVFAHRIDGDGGCLPMSRSLAIRGKRQESPFSCASYFCHLKVSFFFFSSE